MQTQFKLKRLVGALLFASLGATSIAAHAVNVNGGGATLPQPLLEEEFGISGDPAFKITSDSDTWRYGGVGSGGGRNGFYQNNSALHYPGQPAVTVHFGVSDANVPQSEVTTYYGTSGLGNLANPSTGHGRFIQVPLAGTPVLIYAKSVTNSVPGLELNKSQLCGIFSGALATWQAVDSSLPATPIKVIYRTESSGTTTLLTQFLAANCTTAETGGVTFEGLGVFANEFGGAGEPALPARFVGVQGSGGVTAALDDADTDPADGTPEAIAYLSPDPDYFPAPHAVAVPLFNPNITDPNATAIEASTESVTAALGNLPVPSGAPQYNHLAGNFGTATNPANPAAWVTTVPSPAAGYPIVGTTNILVSQCYVGARTGSNPNAVEAAVRNYLDAHYDNIDQIEAHGLVPLPPTLVTGIRNRFINGSLLGGQLQIGNGPAYCNSVAGRG
ncbi:Phosphate-binding protein [Bordetella ansorpii]|uniref:Phosphate-binding protein n=1 Tax=Bordetella ansorpii TaxID=288768 RepID=A0A157SR50_9BORD|nr:substrate-binding domain-containing protein [Bordetella ansorpii]SAI72978.1 Phosphate-binding protein [Bordetella ansorpii]